MIEETARRAVGPAFGAPIVVCNQDHRFIVAEQMRLAGAEARVVLAQAGGAQQRPRHHRGRIAGGRVRCPTPCCG